MDDITVIGGGISGLVASISCAERGGAVRLLEARAQLGGRARTATGQHRTNLGPHALYSDGPAWQWLAQRDLLPAHARPPFGGMRFRHAGRLVRTPPVKLVRALLRRRLQAPPDVDFRSWATGVWGDEVASLLCGACGVFSFDADPGRLSAEFAWTRLLRIASLPPAARYPVSGWSTLVERLADHARARGVRIETNSPVDSLPAGPVIVATELPAAAKLLGDPSLTWTGGTALCFDVAVARRRGDPFVVADLDEGAWVERYSAADDTLAPAGTELLQCQIGMRPDESADDATARLESVVELGFRGWRERETWRRRQVMRSRSGALDLPGTTWRDRPAVERAPGVYLAGDMVAAPGLLAEVSFASARHAAELAVRAAAGASGVTPPGPRRRAAR